VVINTSDSCDLAYSLVLKPKVLSFGTLKFTAPSGELQAFIFICCLFNGAVLSILSLIDSKISMITESNYGPEIGALLCQSHSDRFSLLLLLPVKY